MSDAPQRFPRLPGEAEYKKVDVAALRFDPENPRLGGAIRGGDNEGVQERIRKHLDGIPHYALDLIGSIVENGFLPYEPLIVRQDGQHFIVIEGNRRLAAVQSILAAPPGKYPEEVKESLREIPVLVFPDGAQHGDSDEVLRYLGVKHLFGFRDWPPYSKAMFLDKRIVTKKDLVQVLRELNITKQEAARYLIPYRLRKAAKQIFSKVNAEDFWSLAESFGRKNIRAYIELDVDRRTMRIKGFDAGKLRHLTRFLYGKNKCVTDTRQLSSLSRVPSSPNAARELERGTPLDEALIYVEPKRESIAHLVKQMEKVFDKIRKLSPGKEDAAKIAGMIEEFGKKLKK
jgi:hypothetical protein